MSRLLYNFLWHLVLPFIPLRLWWRGRKESLYRESWRQRFGLAYPARRDSRPLIWLHAVSLGETRAAEPLVRALRERYPSHALLLTHMTATGRATAQQLYGEFATLSFLPYDLPWAVDAFLRHYRPALGIIMETEVWPNLLLAAERHDVPMALVNARLSERSARGYARLGSLAALAFSSFDLVVAQSAADASRLQALGVPRASVGGNLKFDVPQDAGAMAGILREWFEGRRVWLWASTREGEETLLLDALGAQSISDDVLIVLVPRHPQRFEEVAQLMRSRGFSYARRSEGRAPLSTQRFMLGDSMGELSAYYSVCDIAFIGGSLLDFGAQNLIEACAQGAPVLIGPSTYNFAQAVQLALEAGAATQVADATELFERAAELLQAPERRKSMSDAGVAFCAAHRGATERTLRELDALLEESAAR